MMRSGKTHLWLGTATMILTLLLLEPARALNFESALLTAADAIAGAIEHATKHKVAVIDFDQIEGQVTALGRFFAEEISADLAGRPRPFAILDRANLQSILNEHNLSMSALTNPEHANRLGEITGVDALVLGTYTELGETYRLSLRVISTNNAEVVASARTNVPKTTALIQLAAKVLDQPQTHAVPSGASPGPTAQSSAQAAAPAVLYETGVEKGGFEGWPLTSDWKLLNGMLLNDGTGQNRITPVFAPYEPQKADYAIETDIRVINGKSLYGIVVRADKDDGYAVGVNLWANSTEVCYVRSQDCISGNQRFKRDQDWHTYHVEAKGNTIVLRIDGVLMRSISDNRFLLPGRVGLLSKQDQIEVRSFKIIGLEE